MFAVVFGLAEKDWIGKYKCKEYNKLRQSEEYKNIKTKERKLNCFY
jgi:hypothetical protein